MPVCRTDIIPHAGLAPRSKGEKNGSAHLVDRLLDRAEILQDVGEAPTAGLRQVWGTLVGLKGLAPRPKSEKLIMHGAVVSQV